MLRSLSAIGVAVLTVPTLAQAQGAPTFNGTITAGYSFGSADISGIDVDLNAGQIMFEGDLDFGANFALGFDVDLVMGNVSIDGLPVDIDVDSSRIALEPVYKFANGAYVGAYFQMAEIELGIDLLPIKVNADLNSYGIFGGYDTGTWYVEAFAGMSDTDPSLGDSFIPVDINVSDFGIGGGYHISPNFELFGSYTKTTIDIDTVGDVDVAMLALGGEYSMNNGFSVFGSVAQSSLDFDLVSFDATATQFALGVGYDLAAVGSSIPAVLSLEYAHTSVESDLLTIDESYNTITVGVTVPIGGGSNDPLNSSARIARGDYRSAIVGTVGAAF